MVKRLLVASVMYLKIRNMSYQTALKPHLLGTNSLKNSPEKICNFRNLHDDDSIVCYILNLNTEDIYVVNMLYVLL